MATDRAGRALEDVGVVRPGVLGGVNAGLSREGGGNPSDVAGSSLVRS